MISSFQRHRHFSNGQKQEKAMSPGHSAYIPSNVKSPLGWFWVGFWPELPKVGCSRKNPNRDRGWGHGISGKPKSVGSKVKN